MNEKGLTIGLVIVGVIAVLGLFFPGAVQNIINNPPLGASPGGTIPGEQLCVNGVCRIYKQGAFINGTSTPIAVKNPFGATSTVSAEWETTGTSTSAISFDMGTSTLPSKGLNTNIGAAGMNFIASTSIPAGVLAHYSSKATTNFLAGGLAKREIEVGPNEYILLYATSTNPAPGWLNGLDGLIRDRTTWGGRYNLEFKRYQ